MRVNYTLVRQKGSSPFCKRSRLSVRQEGKMLSLWWHTLQLASALQAA